ANLVRLGRLPACEVALAETSVSRQHAELACTAEGWVVRDLCSSNGTFLNGVRVGPAGHAIQPGDIVQVGKVTFCVDAIEGDGGDDPDREEDGLPVVDAVSHDWEELPRALRESAAPSADG